MNQQLFDLLETKYRQYCQPTFLELDPIQIPHRFSQSQDIEIAALVASIFAWGQRKTILNKASDFLARMDNDPYQFAKSATTADLKPFSTFVHRTFNGDDAVGLIKSLQKYYLQHGSLAHLFEVDKNETNYKTGIIKFRETMAQNGVLPRTMRHLPNPEQGSAAKRINMFLRWMVRPANEGVDFGIWKNLSPALLSCPLDVHSGRVGRALGLLMRTQSDWQAVEELDNQLRLYCPTDPVKYDFALFGLGAFEKFA